MKTSELIEQLSWQASDVQRTRSIVRLTPVVLGLAVTVGVFLAAFPLLAHWRDLVTAPGYALRLTVLFLLAWATLHGVRRLFNPAVAWQVSWPALVWPVALLAVAAWARWWVADPDQRVSMLMGRSWSTCSLSLGLLAMPTLTGLMVMARGRAVVRPRLTGAVLGLCAGAITALVYTLHCAEIEPAFVVLWYGLGIALPVVVGAWVGQRLLRC